MLRITEKEEQDKTIILLLEGKVSQDWVKELKSQISSRLDKGNKIILDFAGVSYIDEEAVRMINRFSDQKLSCRNCSLYVRTALKIVEKEKK